MQFKHFALNHKKIFLIFGIPDLLSFLQAWKSNWNETFLSVDILFHSISLPILHQSLTHPSTEPSNLSLDSSGSDPFLVVPVIQYVLNLSVKLFSEDGRGTLVFFSFYKISSSRCNDAT